MRLQCLQAGSSLMHGTDGSAGQWLISHSMERPSSWLRLPDLKTPLFAWSGPKLAGQFIAVLSELSKSSAAEQLLDVSHKAILEPRLCPR